MFILDLLIIFQCCEIILKVFRNAIYVSYKLNQMPKSFYSYDQKGQENNCSRNICSNIIYLISN